jgi:hypothetical protein
MGGCVAIVVMGVSLLAGAASGYPVTEYALKRPRHERCRAHYLRWPERLRHGSTVRCIYQPAPYNGPWDAAHEPTLISNAGVSLASGGAFGLEVKVSRSVGVSIAIPNLSPGRSLTRRDGPRFTSNSAAKAAHCLRLGRDLRKVSAASLALPCFPRRSQQR